MRAGVDLGVRLGGGWGCAGLGIPIAYATRLACGVGATFGREAAGSGDQRGARVSTEHLGGLLKHYYRQAS
jgi:hypothetical protein